MENKDDTGLRQLLKEKFYIALATYYSETRKSFRILTRNAFLVLVLL